MRTMRLALALGCAVLLAACSGLASGARPSDELPPEKAARASQYAADAATGRENQHDRSADPNVPSDDAGDVPVSGFPTRSAGNGTIVETGRQGPPGMNEIDWQNEWYVKERTRTVSVYAGARRDDPTQGVLFVSVWSADEAELLRSFAIAVPGRRGWVKFVGGNGKLASLLAADGTTLTFDSGDLTLR